MFISLLKLSDKYEKLASDILLFVYGSLKHKQPEHYEIKDDTYLGKIKTAPQYKMVKLDSGATGITYGNEAIIGELYKVTQEELDKISNFEWKIYKKQLIELEDGRKAYSFVLKHGE